MSANRTHLNKGKYRSCPSQSKWSVELREQNSFHLEGTKTLAGNTGQPAA